MSSNSSSSYNRRGSVGSTGSHTKVHNLSVVNCLCQANSITCHHRGLICKNSVFTGWADIPRSKGRVKKVAKIQLTAPPARPNPTAHLAVLRNPTHPEWKARPENYLSPALCNISPAYIKRVVETETRELLLKGGGAKSSSFTLARAQTNEINLENEKYCSFKQRQKERSRAVGAEAAASAATAAAAAVTESPEAKAEAEAEEAASTHNV
ncbi:hypothetical protein SBOR_5878 [Sclerotinia borealis F-4128]|uniref:Uncharacterized protein n=1 Tax=Sclerotinia borealis (strain F-4128) TaxID=1432307 RepID=W9CD02_SCLBF|nr:hypothetical protein SBOR_5878 [Sclerotinia borealis F-4128]